MNRRTAGDSSGRCSLRAGASHDHGQTKVSPRSGAALSDSVYNPYPPGILPSDLNPELARVLREVDLIEGERLHAGIRYSPGL